MDIDDDTPKGILLSMSKEMKNMAEAFNKYKIVSFNIRNDMKCL